MARLAPIEPKAAKKRVSGSDNGNIFMSEDFDVLTERELDEWYRVDSRLKCSYGGRRRVRDSQKRALSLLTDPATTWLLSIVSAWELVVKTKAGKLRSAESHSG